MTETVEFNGVRFRRYPNAKQRSDRVYFNPGIADRQRGMKRLHEEIWMAAHGPIPNGCHIHHKDEDPLNNDLSNLECMVAADHARLHHAGRCTPAMQANLDRQRPLAAAWHGSPAGLAWHRQHGIDAFANRTPVPRACEECGANYSTTASTSRFCSNACKSAWRRASGMDDVDRQCVICGRTFRINRYSRSKACSRACAGKLQSRTKTGRP